MIDSFANRAAIARWTAVFGRAPVAVVGASLLGACVAASAALADEVRVFNWSDYIDRDILTRFTEETGVRVVYDVFDSNEVLETRLLAGGSGYDVVVPSGSFLGRQIQAGVFQPLDPALLPNRKHMWDAVAARTDPYDPGGAYSINYMWGTTGIGYNPELVAARLGAEARVDSWALVFDPEHMAALADCGVHFLNAPTELIPAALRYLGEDPNSHDPDVIARAEAVLAGVRPYVRKFHSSEYVNALANGEICVAVGWSGDVLQARDRAAEADRGVQVDYVIPIEGAQMWFDQMAIPADAPNPEAAHVFLNYIMRPEVMAQASNYVYYANGNLASQELLSEDVIGDTAIYPASDTVDQLYTVAAYPPQVNRFVTQLWTRIVTGG